MRQVSEVLDCPCPRCGLVLVPASSAEQTQCPRCRWRGETFLFKRLQPEIDTAELALPDDATCIHHPRKKAVAVCAGTGDYVCSLCAVELNGQTYSAEYLNAGGKQTLGQAFDRFLPRPDSQIRLYLILNFIPYVDFVFSPFAFLWVPHGFLLYFEALRMRRANPLFARVMGRGWIVALPILLSLAAIAWVFIVIAIFVGVMLRVRR